jgi:hypothetical protein
MSRCDARIWDRGAFLRWRRLPDATFGTPKTRKTTLLRRYLLGQLFQGVIYAEMWYLFSFEQRPASQLAVPLGGTQ